MTQPKAKWIEDNRKLRQKNTYFTKQLPIVKGKVDLLTAKLKEQEEAHRKEMNTMNYELLKSTEMYDQLKRDFDIVSGLKMGDLLGFVSGDRL